MSRLPADLAHQFQQAHQTLTRLTQEQAQAKKALKALQQEVLQTICPFYAINPTQRFIPLA